MNFLKLFKGLLKKGIKIGYSTGKAFDPRNQKRTDAMKDFVNSKNKKKKESDKHGNT